MVGGQDVTGRTFELKGTERITEAVIVMTADTARLQGTVMDRAGQPVAATVFLFVDTPEQFGPVAGGASHTRHRCHGRTGGPADNRGAREWRGAARRWSATQDGSRLRAVTSRRAYSRGVGSRTGSRCATANGTLSAEVNPIPAVRVV